MDKKEALQILEKKLSDEKDTLSSLNAELKSYEDDYVILVNAEDELAQANALLDYHIDLEEALGVSIDNIIQLGTKEQVPGFQELFTSFDDEMHTVLGSLSDTSEEYYSTMSDTGKNIDEAKEVISTKIEELKKAINSCEDTIAYYRSLLYA